MNHAESTIALQQAVQRATHELRSLGTAEEKLEYLLERPRLQLALDKEELFDRDKVSGCISGLWIVGTSSESRCFFRSYSDSNVVHAIASFLCDLYTARRAEEILSLPDSAIASLGFDQLLSLNRRQAVRRIADFVKGFASRAAAAAPVFFS